MDEQPQVAPEGMLPGDTFTLDQWVEAQASKVESSAPESLPDEVADAYAAFLLLADKHNIPTLTMLALREHTASKWSLTTDPANVPPVMMMLRAQANADHVHMAKIIGPCMKLQGMPDA